jgi:arylsulfatase A-like enzyme
VPYTAPEAFRKFSPRPLKEGEGERLDIQKSDEKDVPRLINYYDDEIFYTDFCIGKVVEKLEDIGILEDTLFIILGDHGQGFYEHGVFVHGHIPFDEIIRVPLIIKFPEQKFAGMRINGLVELMDLFPSLVNYIGGEVFDYVQGRNFFELLDGRSEKIRDFVFSDTQMLDVHNRYLSVRDNEWKYIKIERPTRGTKNTMQIIKYVLARRLIKNIISGPKHFFKKIFHSENEIVFDLVTDHKELKNVKDEHPRKYEELKKVMEAWRQENEVLAKRFESSKLTHQEEEQLKEYLEKLGYM